MYTNGQSQQGKVHIQERTIARINTPGGIECIRTTV